MAILRHGKKELGSARRIISEDGKRMTITFRGTDRDGRPRVNVSVYRRVER